MKLRELYEILSQDVRGHSMVLRDGGMTYSEIDLEDGSLMDVLGNMEIESISCLELEVTYKSGNKAHA